MLTSVACKVAVVPVDHGQACAHIAGEFEGGDASAEFEGRERMSQIVDSAQWLDPGRDLRWLPLAVAEVVQAEVAAPLGREEQPAVPSRQLALDLLERDRLQRHRPLRLAP